MYILYQLFPMKHLPHFINKTKHKRVFIFLEVFKARTAIIRFLEVWKVITDIVLKNKKKFNKFIAFLIY